MMSSTCIVRTPVVQKPGLGLGLVSFGLRLGLKNLVLFTPSLLISMAALFYSPVDFTDASDMHHSNASLMHR